jgi:hypothetical protein
MVEVSAVELSDVDREGNLQARPLLRALLGRLSARVDLVPIPFCISVFPAVSVRRY